LGSFSTREFNTNIYRLGFAQKNSNIFNIFQRLTV
jgi:hypothetical protein